MIVPCAYEGCGLRRPHWESPHETRGVRHIEVEDGFQGEAFCSIECLTYHRATTKKDQVSQGIPSLTAELNATEKNT